MLRPPLSPAALPTDLKLSNRRQVLEAFKPGGQYTANAISDQIGLSRQTVMKSIAFFMEKGVVVPAGKGDSTRSGGKRPTLYTLAGDRYLLCVSLWPTQLRLALLDFRARVIDARVELGAFSRDIRQLLAQAGALSGQLLARNQLSPSQLAGVSVSASGLVSYGDNTLKYSTEAPQWGKNIPIADILRPYFAPHTPILVDNLSKMTARSLLHQPELRDQRILVLCAARMLSGSLIVRDRIQCGRDSLIGEIGHMILSLDHPDMCSCGGAGCFEQLVSDERIRRLVASATDKYPASPLYRIPSALLTVRDVFAASEQGDPLARALDSGLARIFSVALRNISLVFGPDTVVFQGRYADADEFFRSELLRHLQSFRYYSAAVPFSLHLDRRPLAELDRQGAYTMLIDHLFSDSALYE